MVNIIIDLWDIFYYWFTKYMYFFMYVWYVDNELEFKYLMILFIVGF